MSGVEEGGKMEEGEKTKWCIRTKGINRVNEEQESFKIQKNKQIKTTGAKSLKGKRGW